MNRHRQPPLTMNASAAWVLDRRRGLRLGIWAIFLLVLVGSWALAGPVLHPANSSGAAVTASAPAKSTAQTIKLLADGSAPVASTTGSCATGTCAVDPAHPSTPIHCNTGTDLSCFSRYSKDPSGFLPAYRWRGATGLYSNLGSFDIAGTLFSFLGTLLFTVASFMWFLLLGIVNWALNLNLVTTAAGTINSGFKSIANSITGSGAIVWGVVFVAAIFLVRMLLRLSLIHI